MGYSRTYRASGNGGARYFLMSTGDPSNNSGGAHFTDANYANCVVTPLDNGTVFGVAIASSQLNSFYLNKDVRSDYTIDWSADLTFNLALSTGHTSPSLQDIVSMGNDEACVLFGAGNTLKVGYITNIASGSPSIAVVDIATDANGNNRIHRIEKITDTSVLVGYINTSNHFRVNTVTDLAGTPTANTPATVDTGLSTVSQDGCDIVVLSTSLAVACFTNSSNEHRATPVTNLGGSPSVGSSVLVDSSASNTTADILSVFRLNNTDAGFTYVASSTERYKPVTSFDSSPSAGSALTIANAGERIYATGVEGKRVYAWHRDRGIVGGVVDIDGTPAAVATDAFLTTNFTEQMINQKPRHVDGIFVVPYLSSTTVYFVLYQ